MICVRSTRPVTFFLPGRYKVRLDRDDRMTDVPQARYGHKGERNGSTHINREVDRDSMWVLVRLSSEAKIDDNAGCTGFVQRELEHGAKVPHAFSIRL